MSEVQACYDSVEAYVARWKRRPSHISDQSMVDGDTPTHQQLKQTDRGRYLVESGEFVRPHIGQKVMPKEHGLP
jgi:hypothetical protein